MLLAQTFEFFIGKDIMEKRAWQWVLQMKAYFETRIMIANGGLVLNGSIFVLQACNGVVDNEFGVKIKVKRANQ